MPRVNVLIDNDVWEFPSHDAFMRWRIADRGVSARSISEFAIRRVASVDMVWAGRGSSVCDASARVTMFDRRIAAVSAVRHAAQRVIATLGEQAALTAEEQAALDQALQVLSIEPAHTPHVRTLADCEPYTVYHVVRHLKNNAPCAFKAWRLENGAVHIIDANGRVQMNYSMPADQMIVGDEVRVTDSWGYCDE